MKNIIQFHLKKQELWPSKKKNNNNNELLPMGLNFTVRVT